MNKKETNPLISVIVPIYNTAKYLPKCLDSIINQTYQNLEIILIDDGSTDDSGKIADQYAHKNSRIKVIHQKNQGLSGARNTGIKKTTGAYITFVDSDDYIEPKMIEHLISSLYKTRADVSCCSFKEVYPNGKTIGFNHNHQEHIFTTKAALRAMLKEEGFMVSTTMKLFPTKFFKDIKFPEGKLHEDVGTTYKLILKASKIAFIPYEDYVYVHHNDSIINNSFNDQKFDLIELTDQMCDDIDKHYPTLKNTTNERRIRARFSILRQIPTNHPKTKGLISYLKTHQSFITKNPEATTVDKIALKLALTSLRLFQLSYKLFK